MEMNPRYKKNLHTEILKGYRDGSVIPRYLLYSFDSFNSFFPLARQEHFLNNSMKTK